MKTKITAAFNAVFAKGQFNPNQALIVFTTLAFPLFITLVVLGLTGVIHVDKF